MANQSTIAASFTANFNVVPGAGPLAGQQLSPQEILRFATKISGVAADQVDGISYNPLVFVASTPQTLDLTTALKDVLGNALTVARVRFVAWKVYWQTDNVPLLVGGAGGNEWLGFLSPLGAKLSVFPSSANNDGWAVLTAPQSTGIPVTGSSKLLKLDPQSASGPVDFIAGTCSA